MKRIYLIALFITLVFVLNTLAQDSPQWHLPEGAKMRLGKGRAGEIAYSPDGTKLAVASGIGIWIYDAQTGEELDLFPANRFEVRNIAFSPDGSMLASDSFDCTINYWSIENRTVRLWDVKSRRQIRTFTGHKYPISRIAFSPDGKTIAGSADNDVHVWDVESGRQLHRLWGIGSSVTSIVFSPDSKTLATSGYLQEFFCLWDVETGDFMRWFEGHRESISSLAFHPDGQLIASGSYDNTVRLWDVDTGVEERSFTRHTDSVYTVAFSPDGNTLASGGQDNNIWLTNIFDGTPRGLLSGDMDSIRTVVFGQDSYTLASRSSDGTIHLWNDITGNGRVGWERRVITGHIDRIGNIAFSPDGNMLVSVGRDKVLRLWDVNTGTKQHTFVGHTDYIDSVAFSPDGKTIASGSKDGTLRLWDVDTGTERHTLINMLGEVDHVAFTPDSKTVMCVMLTGDYNPSIRLRSSIIYLFDVETGAELHRIVAYNAPPPAYSYEPEFHPTEHTEPVTRIALSPHGNIIASSSYDKTIRLWHVQTGEHLRVFAELMGTGYYIAFSPNGDLLAFDIQHNNIHLWDVQTGKHLRIFTGRTDDDLDYLTLSADGSMLASVVAEDETIFLFDVQSGMKMRTLPGHKGGTYNVAFSADGSTLASSSGDGTIFLWDLNAPLPSNTIASLSPVRVESPVVGEQLTLSLNIGYGQNVAGYQATVNFDVTALRFVESSNGDYLPTPAYVMPPVVEDDRVTLAATSFADESHNDGTLATITFEVVATKASTVRLSDVILTDSTGNSISPKIITATEITEPMFLPEDVNEDGVVNILDLAFIAANFGKTGKNAADINRDGVVNIVDLTLVAAVIGDADAAAPVLQFRNQEAAWTRADIAAWLQEARNLNLPDPAFQRGLLVLESLLKAFTPKETALLPNYPNPFNPETWIPYQLAASSDISILIYAADGKLVRQLDLGHQSVGMYHHRSRAAYWDGKNAQGEPVASGVYFYTLTAGEFASTRRMLIRK